MKKDNLKPQIIIYVTKDGQTKLQVKIKDETVWLTQDEMAVLFDKGRSTIAEHIQNIFKEQELKENLVCRDFRRTGASLRQPLRLPIQITLDIFHSKSDIIYPYIC